MITIEKAYRLILDNLPACRSERVRFETALGRVLAEDVCADADVPAFNRSAVDGYALRATDVAVVPAGLELIGEVRAGSRDDARISPGEAMAITTGAPVPDGADAVQMLEYAQCSSDRRSVTIQRNVAVGENIVPRGFEASAGQKVLEAGRRLGPAELAVLATFGCSQVAVWRRPRVALLVTGDELIEVERTPLTGQIRNSNAYSLSGQLKYLGIEPDYLGIARDETAELRRKVEEGLQRDVMVISGGASVGPYDLVKSVFGDLGIEIVFARVAIRPGRPTIFARKGSTLIFGLPGNPVSSFVSFENFVRPVLGRMCGFARPDLPRIEGELQTSLKQAWGRTSFLPAIVSWEGGGWKISPLPWKGSGDIIGFSRSNALVIFPGDRDLLARGSRVEALLLPDFLDRRPL